MSLIPFQRLSFVLPCTGPEDSIGTTMFGIPLEGSTTSLRCLDSLNTNLALCKAYRTSHARRSEQKYGPENSKCAIGGEIDSDVPIPTPSCLGAQLQWSYQTVHWQRNAHFPQLFSPLFSPLFPYSKHFG